MFNNSSHEEVLLIICHQLLETCNQMEGKRSNYSQKFLIPIWLSRSSMKEDW
jgi:hypothetical protein